MKRIILVLILILFIPIYVKADLTKKQQEDIGYFAAHMIEEGFKAPHLDSKGFSVFAYNQGTRNEGFNNQLSYMYKDYNRINDINGKKWTFDCASFAAYVYYHCFGVKTTYLSNNSPYVVSKFVEEANKGNNWYYVMTNVNTSTMDYSKLKKGDLVIFVNSHIMVYVGDGKIAHFSTSALKKGSNLGCEVIALNERFPNRKASIIRLKDGIVPTTAKANMKITWPDTGKTQDFRDDLKDDKPVVNLSLNNENNKATITINLSDDKGLTGYYISNKSGTPTSWHSINNSKSFKTTYEAKNNGTYHCYVKDSKNQISHSSIKVEGLDKEKPVISNVIYKYNKDNDNFRLEVKATDNNKIVYALDSNNYQESNIFENVNKGEHKVYVKDTADNVVEFSFNLSTDLIPTINLNYDTNYVKTLVVRINAVDTEGINGYAVTRTNEEPKSFMTYNDNTSYNITINGDYYFWVRNTRGTVNYQKITVNNIDNTPPIISNVEVTKKSGSFNVVITATDVGCGISGYSLDGQTYQEENTFSEAKTIYNKVFVKDKCNNIANYDVDISNIPAETTGTDSTTIILILIIIVVAILIFINLKSINKKR